MRPFFLVTLALYLGVSAAALRAGQAPGGPGRTVWDGAFTAAQAERGRILYGAHCAECHGGNLQGGEGKALVGETFWNDWREQTVEDLLTYVSANMPFSEDGSLKATLSPTTYAEIVAHMLAANGLPAGATELTRASSAGVAIITKDGPGELPPNTLAQVVGCLAPRGADGSWRLVKATAPVRRTATGPKPPADGPLGDREYALKFVIRNLTGMVGHRVAVSGLLLGTGGADGLNVNTVESVAPTCG